MPELFKFSWVNAGLHPPPTGQRWTRWRRLLQETPQSSRWWWASTEVPGDRTLCGRSWHRLSRRSWMTSRLTSRPIQWTSTRAGSTRWRPKLERPGEQRMRPPSVPAGCRHCWLNNSLYKTLFLFRLRPVSCLMTWLQSKPWATRRWGPDWRPPLRTWRPSLTNSCPPLLSRWIKFRTFLADIVFLSSCVIRFHCFTLPVSYCQIWDAFHL